MISRALIIMRGDLSDIASGYIAGGNGVCNIERVSAVTDTDNFCAETFCKLGVGEHVKSLNDSFILFTVFSIEEVYLPERCRAGRGSPWDVYPSAVSTIRPENFPPDLHNGKE